MRRIGVTVGVGLIHLYRLVFAWLPSSCRFEPSCSRYTEQAIQKYGLLRGSWMGAKRIGRCHPGTRAATTRSPTDRRTA